MDIVDRLRFGKCDPGPTSDPIECELPTEECPCAINAEAATTITALRKRVEELEGALGESYSTLAAAFARVHCLPRTTDTDLANRIEVTRAKIAALRAKGGEHGE